MAIPPGKVTYCTDHTLIFNRLASSLYSTDSLIPGALFTEIFQIVSEDVLNLQSLSVFNVRSLMIHSAINKYVFSILKFISVNFGMRMTVNTKVRASTTISKQVARAEFGFILKSRAVTQTAEMHLKHEWRKIIA